jgi:hypothetical protein
MEMQLRLVRFRLRIPLRLAVTRNSVGLGAKLLQAHYQLLFIFLQVNPYVHSPYVI